MQEEFREIYQPPHQKKKKKKKKKKKRKLPLTITLEDHIEQEWQ